MTGASDKVVVCGVCGSDIDYSVLLDAINIRPCRNGCVGSVFFSRAAVLDATNDMIKKLDDIVKQTGAVAGEWEL